MSRGARQVVLVEEDPRVFRTLCANAAALSGERVQPALQPMRSEVFRFLARRLVAGAFDLIFADPPYAGSEITTERLQQAIMQGGWLATTGCFIYEQSRATPASAVQGWQLQAERRYGETLLRVYTIKERQG